MDFNYSANRIFIENEEHKLLAEVLFPDAGEDTVDITHTFVDDSLRGQGIAGKLMEEVTSELGKNRKKVILTCPYAQKWFDKHPEYRHLVK